MRCSTNSSIFLLSIFEPSFFHLFFIRIVPNNLFRFKMMPCVHMLSETHFSFAAITTIITLKALRDYIAGFSNPIRSLQKFNFFLKFGYISLFSATVFFKLLIWGFRLKMSLLWFCSLWTNSQISLLLHFNPNLKLFLCLLYVVFGFDNLLWDVPTCIHLWIYSSQHCSSYI